jgi:hypothetical protein
VFEEPEDRDVFGILVTTYVGAAGEPGADLFEFRVCTPRWLAANVALPKSFAFLRHHLVVAQWDQALVERAIGDLCAHTERADWKEIALKLSRYGQWEFEDYVE